MQPPRRVVVLAAVLASLSPAARADQAPAPAQQPGLTFRAAANYVEVDALVTNRDGTPVRDLTIADFDVSEDGRPQVLRVCSFIDIPIAPLPVDARGPAATRVEADVATNEQPFEGRVFMIVLDGHHVAAEREALVRREAQRFVDRYVGPRDIAAVVDIGNPGAGQEFTADRTRLAAAVGRFVGRGIISATEAMLKDAVDKSTIYYNSGRRAYPGPPEDTEAGTRLFLARASIDAIRRLSETVSSMAGRRKTLLLFSEGFALDDIEYPTPLPPLKLKVDRMDVLKPELRTVLGSAKRAGVAFYTIDPRGLAMGTEELARIKTPQRSVAGGLDYSLPPSSPPEKMLQDDYRRAMDTLQVMANETGGKAFTYSNDFDETFRGIVQDNSAYYMLGYASPDARRDGRFHRVSVKVKRPGLQVRARDGYNAPLDPPAAQRQPPPDVVNGLLAQPAATTGLGMRANAGVIKGLLEQSTVHLTVELSGKDIEFKHDGAEFTNDIEMKYVAIDMAGRTQASRREVAHLKLQARTQEVFADNGLRWVTEFELPPGRYQVRVAARDQLGGKAGSVFCDVDVPDVAIAPLVLSDVLITSASATKTTTAKAATTLGALFPTPTTTARSFARADTLTALAAVYDNVSEAHTVDLVATMTNEAGTVVMRQEEARDSTELHPTKGGYRWTVTLPLEGVVPGRYVLAVEARSRLQNAVAVRKAVEIVVR